MSIRICSNCRISTLLLFALSFALCSCPFGAAHADNGLPTVTIEANPNILYADGRSKATITATVSDGQGHSVPDGTQVHFSTNNGSLDTDIAVTTGGVARTKLTSSPIAGRATVTASFIGSVGGASGSFTIEFTSEADLANTDQIAANWIRVTSTDYLAYSADSKTIDAAGRKRGVKIAYRGVTIEANAAQVDLDADMVRAQHALISRGIKPPIAVDSLVYYLDAQQGTAIIIDAPGIHTVQQVNVDGHKLTTEPVGFGPAGSSSSHSDYDFLDLSQGHVLVTAAAVSVEPHSQIQLARATIYIDSKKIVSMPNQVMPLSTDQPFGQQVIGYGTTGLFVDVPYYASLTPTSTGMFSLRSPAASIQAGTFYNGRNSFALDYDRTYNYGNRTGDFKLIGISRGDWGLRWSHSQKFAGGTQAYFYLDSPQHQSLYGSSNLRHDFGVFAMNLDMTESRPIGNEIGTFGNTVNVGLATPSHLFFGSKSHGLFHSEQYTYTTSHEQFKFANQSISASGATGSAGVRFNTSPIMPDRNTTVVDSFVVERSTDYSSRFTAINMLGNVQVMTKLSQYANANFNYNYTHNPHFSTPTPLVEGNNLLALYNATDQHNLTLGLGLSPPNRLWDFSISSTYGLPTQDMTIGDGLNYRISSQMHLSVDQYFSHIAGYDYRDYDFSLSHRIGTRDLVVSWSALLHRWQINLAQAQF